MTTEENTISYLERKVEQLEKHIADQDGEMFRMGKQIEQLAKRCEKLEGRLDADSPIDPGREPDDEKPPHY
jgi:uncharacterized coiled-coil protein SlyX